MDPNPNVNMKSLVKKSPKSKKKKKEEPSDDYANHSFSIQPKKDKNSKSPAKAQKERQVTPLDLEKIARNTVKHVADPIKSKKVSESALQSESDNHIKDQIKIMQQIG